MTSTYTTKITDKNHRISIDKHVWDFEDLKVGDYLEVTIKKIKKEEKQKTN